MHLLLCTITKSCVLTLKYGMKLGAVAHIGNSKSDGWRQEDEKFRASME